jgi:hypothetical protein
MGIEFSLGTVRAMMGNLIKTLSEGLRPWRTKGLEKWRMSDRGILKYHVEDQEPS